MQTSINPALAAAMTLEQAAQAGEFQPMTREGQPTVAAQLMQRAMPPSIPDVVQQAGIGNQIQTMQAQEAQKELMNRMMQQTRPPAGLEGLNPQMGNFAEGGIVGYAGGGEPTTGFAPLYQEARSFGIDLSPYDSPEVRKEKLERLARMKEASKQFGTAQIPGQAQEVKDLAASMMPRPAPAPVRPTMAAQAAPVAPPPAAPRPAAPERSALAGVRAAPMPEGGIASVRPAGPGASANMYDEARKRLQGIATQPVSPEQGIEGALAQRRAMDEYRRQLGLPPEIEQINQQEQEFGRLMSERERVIAQRMQDLEKQKERESLSEFMMNFRYGRGQPFSQGITNAVRGLGRYEKGMAVQQQQLQDLQQQVQMFSFEKRNALAKMRDDIARGDFNGAMQSKQKAQEADNKVKEAMAKIDLEQAKAMSEEEKARITARPQSTETERVMAEYRRLLQRDPRAAKEYLDLYMQTKSGGRPAGSSAGVELRQDSAAFQRMKADGRYKATSEALARAEQMRQSLKPGTDPKRVEEVNRRYEAAVKAYADLAQQYGVKIGEMPTAAPTPTGSKTLEWGTF